MRLQNFTARLRIGACALVFMFAGCSERNTPTAAAPAQTPKLIANAAWEPFTATFLQGYFERDPYFAANQGKHEFDGRMPDWSATGLGEKIRWLKSQRAAAVSMDSKTLSPSQHYQRDYVLWIIDRDLFWLEAAQAPQRNPAWYVDDLDPDMYLSRDYAPLQKRMAGYTGYAAAIPRLAANIRDNMRTPLPRSYVEYAIAGFGGFADFFRKDVPQVFASVKDAELQRQFATANSAATKAMADLKLWFVAQRGTATDDFAIGPELFAQMLRDTERTDLPLAAVEAAGRADLERNLAALKSACAQYLPSGTSAACVAKMARDKPKNGAIAEARAQLDTLRAFLLDQGVVSIPSQDIAAVKQAPPYNSQNAAYMNIAGPYDKGLGGSYFIAPPDPSWSKADQAAYIPAKATLLFTSVHEVWPGHFLQYLHANRNPFEIASVFVGYGYAEGWAHYTEEMMYEMGLGANDPATHIGQLEEALLRNVRLLSAIGLHTAGMTLAQSEKMFREQAFQDAGNARQQAARGTYDPAYLNYTLSKLMIRKLRDDWTVGRGGKRSWHAFHDQFLSYGGPPVTLVRRQMLGVDTPAL